MASSEWIEKLRAAAAMCRSPDDDLDYKYWAAVAFDMLPKASAYIGQQATALDEAEALIKKNADQINALLAQVAALKELAEWERASRLRDQVDYETDDEMMPEFCRDAIRQLSEEHPEVDWE